MAETIYPYPHFKQLSIGTRQLTEIYVGPTGVYAISSLYKYRSAICLWMFQMHISLFKNTDKIGLAMLLPDNH